MRSLRTFTNARVDLGRVGDSVPTRALLEFRLAHARARDAVHLPMDSHSLVHEFAAFGWNSVVLKSQARDREQYLLRPDLGRSLSDESRTAAASLERGSQAELGSVKAADAEPPRRALPAFTEETRLLFCVADGLSAAAVHRHAAHLLKELKPPSPVVLVEQARVAIGDEIGELAGAEICVLLIGERPGLSSPDSLGVYITYGPKVGRHDADRNCVSNIHDQGLSYKIAAQKILYLINEARIRKLSGVDLKERADLALPPHCNVKEIC